MIGSLIYTVLTGSTSLTALIPAASIYPYVINESTALPAMIYTIDSLSPYYNKDVWAGDICTFSITTYSNNYTQLQNIAQQVRTTLEFVKGSYDSITIDRVELEGLTEGYNLAENCFLNKLTFSARITSY